MAKVVEAEIGGLFLSGNELTAPNGSMTTADEIWHPERNVLEPRPSRRVVTPALPTDLNQTDHLVKYGASILLHNPTNGAVGIFGTPQGSVSEYATKLYRGSTKMGVKGAEAGKNCYVTSTAGIYRFSGTTDEPTLAGAPVATGFVSAVTTGTSGWLATAKTVAYRTAFATRDTFERLYLGSPSGRILLTNTAGATRDTEVTVLIPADVSTDDYLRVYRTAEVDSGIDPGDEMALVHEIRVTSDMLTDGTYTFTDTTPSEVRGANLYTNPNSGQGILQANDPPPVALDVATWGNRLWFLNTRRAHSLNIEMLGVGPGAPGSEETGVRQGDGISLSLEGGTLEAQFRGLEFTSAGSVNYFEIVQGGSAAANVRDTAKNLVASINQGLLTDGTTPVSDYVRAVHVSSPDDPQGKILLEAVSPLVGEFTVEAMPHESFPTVSDVSRAAGVVTLTFIIPDNATDFYAVGDTVQVILPSSLNVEGTFIITDVTTTTISYASPGADGLDAGARSGQINRATPTGGTAWSPNLDVPRESKDEATGHRLYYSKLDEFEAVPKVNYLDIGDETKQGWRLVPVRDRLYVLKDDGAFVVSGEFPFRVDIFDPTLRIAIPDSVATVDNIVFADFNGRIHALSEGGARVIDDGIHADVQDILLGSNSSYPVRVAGDSYRHLYYLQTSVGTYVYNVKTNQWTTWRLTARSLIEMPGEAKATEIYYITYQRMMKLGDDRFYRASDTRWLLGDCYNNPFGMANQTLGTSITLLNADLHPTFPIQPGHILSGLVGGVTEWAVVDTVTVGATTTEVTVLPNGASGDFGTDADTLDHHIPFTAKVRWTVAPAGSLDAQKLFREEVLVFTSLPASDTLVAYFDSDTGEDPVEYTVDTNISPTMSVYENAAPTRNGAIQTPPYLLRPPRTLRLHVPQEHAFCNYLETGFSKKVDGHRWRLIGRSLILENASDKAGVY